MLKTILSQSRSHLRLKSMDKHFLKETSAVESRKRSFLASMKSGRLVETSELVGDLELMNDKEVVLCMLQTKGGDLLIHVSERLKDDEDVVFQACTNEGVNPPMNDPTALVNASSRLKSSKLFIDRLLAYYAGDVHNQSLINRFSSVGKGV